MSKRLEYEIIKTEFYSDFELEQYFCSCYPECNEKCDNFGKDLSKKPITYVDVTCIMDNKVHKTRLHIEKFESLFEDIPKEVYEKTTQGMTEQEMLSWYFKGNPSPAESL